jgi:hypothetical protein
MLLRAIKGEATATCPAVGGSFGDMQDQPNALSTQSRFAGALFKKTQPHRNLLAAFLLQLFLIWLANYLTLFALFPVYRDPLPTLVEASSLRHIFFIVVFLAIAWLCVWIMSKAIKNFWRLIMPQWTLTIESDDEDNRISIMEEAFKREAGYTDKEATLSNKLRVIQAIDARTARLRKRTSLMLFTAGVLLVGASLIIIFAGTLTNLDVSAASNVDKVGAAITDAEGHLAKLSDLQQSLNKLSAVDATPDDRAAQQKKIADLRFDRTLPADEAGAAAQIAAEQKRLAELQDLYTKAWTSEMNSEHGYNDVRYIIATAITRIGVVLVIIFLAQILIGLYRYNTRLITFYHSRRDLAQIWDGKIGNIDKLQKLMAPNIDFGKEPKHPLDEIIRQVIAKLPLGTGAAKEGAKNPP